MAAKGPGAAGTGPKAAAGQRKGRAAIVEAAGDAVGGASRVRKAVGGKAVAAAGPVAAPAKAKAGTQAAPGSQGAARPKAAPARRAAKAAVAEVVAAPVAAVTLRKKDLIERVARVAGARKKDARGIVEATLSVLGAALAAGEVLALPPLGKARVNRQKDMDGGGAMLTVKLRRPGRAAPRAAAAADAPDGAGA